ncbi:UNVERIFIED_CONTAM: hypothetical protein Sradi_0866300 [Sesamum radiatum]|uniref:RNase H type-1 domain-containing protein n=1 Tax=Sesamum radiatum TaxID=300843 RepID=A0AAW2V3W5_SESRA
MTITLGRVLPKVLSLSQSSFAPGRLLSDNVLLAQELIHSLKSRWPEANVVFKLDIAKAYDRGCAMMNLSHGGRLALIRSVRRPHHCISFSGKGWIGCSESARLCSGLCHEAVVAVSEQIPIAPGQGDNIVWKGSSERAFLIKSAWEAIQMTSPRRQLLIDVRHRSLRLTISVFLWQLFQDRIPVDAKMKQKGLRAWQHFATLFGLRLCDTGNLTHMRNATKYRRGSFSTDGIILEVQLHLRTLYAARTLAIYIGLGRWDSFFDSRFIEPLALYSDGHVHRAYQVTLGTENIVIAEVTVVWRGLELALAHGLTPLVVEVNAMAVIQLLQSYASGKWEVQHLILHIVQIQQMLVSDFRHTFKEANVAIDHLVKEAASLQLTRVLGHGDITGVLRSNLNRDRRGVPHLRRGR